MDRNLEHEQRGFTLIELMIVVAIIGVLAAVAIPTFMDMTKKAKRSEAEVNLNAITKGAKAYHVEHAGFPVSDGTGMVPAMPCCHHPGRKCQPDAELWTAAPGEPATAWDQLGFSVGEPALFRYFYTSVTGRSFTAIASGDLDCDGTEIEYQMLAMPTDGNPTYTLTRPAGGAD